MRLFAFCQGRVNRSARRRSFCARLTRLRAVEYWPPCAGAAIAAAAQRPATVNRNRDSFTRNPPGNSDIVPRGGWREAAGRDEQKSLDKVSRRHAECVRHKIWLRECLFYLDG